MPTVLSPRHESFVRLYIETGNAAVSYRRAGYTPTTRSGLDAAASRLARKGKIQRRMLELMSQLAKRNAITLDTLLDDLAADRALARELGQPSAAIAATQLTAKLCGLLVDRKEHGQPSEFAGLQSEVEVIAKVREELGEEAARQLSQALQQTDQP